MIRQRAAGLVVALFLFFAAGRPASSDISIPSEPQFTAPKIIFDTDMSGDCDDVGALAILNKMEDFGECEILACVVNGHDRDKSSAASIDAINTYYARPNIPIGTYQGSKSADSPSRYTAHLRDEFPHTALADDKESKALDVYRGVLAAAPAGSVTVVSVGFLMNLRDLLESSADEHSPLSGADLVRRKVKQLVVMGGKYPQSDPKNGEYNFAGFGAGLDTQYIVEHWPTPILFSGFEIGQAILTGKKLVSAPTANPVRRAYELYDALGGHASFDLTAAFAAVRPPHLYWDIVDGYCQVADNGTDTWSTAPHGHSYLVAKTSNSDMAAILDDLLTLPPRR
jgi:hypothetical protein